MASAARVLRHNEHARRVVDAVRAVLDLDPLYAPKPNPTDKERFGRTYPDPIGELVWSRTARRG